MHQKTVFLFLSSTNLNDNVTKTNYTSVQIATRQNSDEYWRNATSFFIITCNDEFIDNNRYVMLRVAPQNSLMERKLVRWKILYILKGRETYSLSIVLKHYCQEDVFFQRCYMFVFHFLFFSWHTYSNSVCIGWLF